MSKHEEPTPDDEGWDWNAARKKLAPKHDNRKAARKGRQKRLSDAVDGRSLKATGRTEQFNFKSMPGLKDRARAAAEREGVSLAVWMERVVQSALGEEPTEE
jgi:hypothetical protein